MTERSPIEILGEIIDEVEGLRRTDPRSHLPPALLREAKSAFDSPTVPSNGLGLNDVSLMVGKTVTHVFDSGLDSGDLVIVFSDKTFIALLADRDFEEVFINVSSGKFHGGKELTEFVSAGDLAHAGLISRKLAEEIADKKAMAEAEENFRRFSIMADAAKAELDKLKQKMDSE